MTARQQKLFDTVREILETDEQRITAENHQEVVSALTELKQALEQSGTMAEDQHQGVLSALDSVADAVKDLDMSPVVNLPAPVVNVPEANITVKAPEINLKPLQDTIERHFPAPETQDTRLDLGCYRAMDLMESGDRQYVGFVNPDGQWYIIENDLKKNSMRYLFGDKGYARTWPNAPTYKYELLNKAISHA